MKPSISLARSLSQFSTTVGSKSRIPHLKIHILHRQRVKPATSSIQKRALHSAVLEPPGFATFGQRSEELAENDYQADLRTEHKDEKVQDNLDWEKSKLKHDILDDQTIESDSSAQIETDTFQSLLEDNLPERTLFWLLHHPNGVAFTEKASDQDFALVISSLDPDIIFSAFKITLKSMQFTTRDLGDVAQHDRSIVRRLHLFLPSVHELLRRREDAGWPINLELIRHALKCCVAVGDKKAALAIVDNMAPAFNVELDLECYNHLMEVQITNRAQGSIALGGRALNQHLFDLRSRLRYRPPSVRGYTVSADDPEPLHTLRGQALQVFQVITKKGLQPTEKTFVNLMTALAKSGDLSGVDSILKSVWNIDAHALDTFDEEEIEGPTFYADDHPLHPTSRLLFAIVYAYGLNKDEKKAASLLDYVSRNYAIDIPLDVWEELFTWTYANNLHKSARRRDQGQAFGSRRSQDVEILYQKVVDLPYNLEPSPRILDLRARHFRVNRQKERCFDTIRMIRKQALPMIDHLQGLIRTAKALQRHPYLVTTDGMPSKELFALRRDFQLAYLQALAHLTMFRRNLKRALTDKDTAGMRSWPRCGLPMLVQEFYDHLPLSLTYRIDTGSVQMTRKFGAKEGNPLWLTLNQASLFWDAIAAPDPGEVAEKLANVPDDLTAAAMAVFGGNPNTSQNDFATSVASAVLTGFGD